MLREFLQFCSYHICKGGGVGTILAQKTLAAMGCVHLSEGSVCFYVKSVCQTEGVYTVYLLPQLLPKESLPHYI